MRYTHVIFDLDGTLLNTLPGIIASLDYAFEQNGYSGPYDKSIIAGPPLNEVVATATGFTGQKLEDTVQSFRQYYDTNGKLMAQPYDGIAALLKALHERGARCYIATSKLEEAARFMAQHFGLAPYLTDVSGATRDLSRGDKTSVLKHLLATNHIEKPRAVMVGDRNLDLIGAKNVGIDAIGVAYGFAPSPQELYDAHPLAVVQDVAALSRLLLEDA